MTSTRGSRHGVENPCRPLAVLRPRWVAAEAYRPPSRLTRTRLPARGPVAWHGHVEGRLERRITQADAG